MNVEISVLVLNSLNRLVLCHNSNAKMVKVFGSLFLLLVATTKECSKKKEGGIPTCIQVRIDSIKAQPRWNPPARVDEYTYEGKTVYLFSAPCCDQYYTAYDKDCKYICAPSGGMTGKGDRKCTDFSQKAVLVRVVWKDER